MHWRRTVYLCDGRCGVARCAILARDAEELLGIGFGETTADGRIRLSTLRCPEREGNRAYVIIDDDVYLIEYPEDFCELILGEFVQSGTWPGQSPTVSSLARRSSISSGK